MKKLNKILLSLCMVFCLTFTLVGCNIGEDSDTPYKPPVGVDMTSANEYGEWLIENTDMTASFVATMFSNDFNGNPTTKLIKYKYKNDVQCIATYDGSANLTEYVEISKITSASYMVKRYNPSTMTYTESVVSKDDMVRTRGNLYLSNEILMNMWQIEINQGLDIGTDITALPGYSGVTSTTNITNPSTGKYTLSRTLSGTVADESIEWITNAVVENDRVTSFTMDISSEGGSEGSVTTHMEVSYEYKNVDFSVTTAGYTKSN